MSYTDCNAATIDRWIENGWEWGKPISHQIFQNALQGHWDVLLTPTRAVPHSWFGSLKNKKVLGLASGGGQQMPVFTALGAECTVLDYSIRQLESEKMVAQREGYQIEIVRGDMTKPLPFADESFDLIFHPVSNVYIEKVEPVFQECFRVLKKGGVLLCGLDNGFCFLFDDEEKNIIHTLPFNPLKNPEQMAFLEKTDSGVQFSHTAEEQLGGQLKAGFTLMDILEDTSGSGFLHEHNVPTFYMTRAKK